LTNATLAEAAPDWQTSVNQSLTAFKLLSTCDPFATDARSTASIALGQAMDKALAANQGEQYAARLQQEVATNPTVELYTALLNYYSRTGQMTKSISALDAALKLIPESDPTTRKQYTDFRASLVTIQQVISQTITSPNDAE
jgi:tetratricopeptide (TPR) repeat protein